MAKVDVLIVGGGIAGASLGARLASSMSVMLIEAEDLCGRHATGRSAAFWQASLGGDTPERRLSLAVQADVRSELAGHRETPLLRARGAVHLTGPCGETMEEVGDLSGEFAPVHLDRQRTRPADPRPKREQWTGAWYEASCADIEVAAFHAACLGARSGGRAARCRTDAALLSARRSRGSWKVETSAGPIEAAYPGQCRRRMGRPGRGACRGRRHSAWSRGGGRSSSCASAGGDCSDLPFVTDLHESFYFKGEGDNSVWVCPLDETLVDPCDAAPEEIDVAIAIDRFEKAVDWPVEAVERKWAGLRTFAPDRGMKFGFDPLRPKAFSGASGRAAWASRPRRRRPCCVPR